MKATRANLLGEFTGKLDGLIYYRNGISGKLYVRRQFAFRDHPAQPHFRAVQQAAMALQPSEAYKQDFRDYLFLYNRLPENRTQPAHAWTNLYVKMMYAMQRSLPLTVDLENITREQITAQNLPCRSLKDVIEAELLPRVKGYERFMAEM